MQQLPYYMYVQKNKHSIIWLALLGGDQFQCHGKNEVCTLLTLTLFSSRTLTHCDHLRVCIRGHPQSDLYCGCEYPTSCTVDIPQRYCDH